MKKYISLLSFLAIFFVGMQQSQAQESSKQDAQLVKVAKEEVSRIDAMVSLTNDQKREIYSFITSYNQSIVASGRSKKVLLQMPTELADARNEKIKKFLNAEQVKLLEEGLKE
ncbi:MAG: hypothetical protein ACPG6B_09800 [Oceanihabitans sp.]